MIEDDRAKRGGADAAERETPNLYSEIACPGGERDGDRDQVAAVREVDAVLNSDAAGGRGNEAEDDQRQPADHRLR